MELMKHIIEAPPDPSLASVFRRFPGLRHRIESEYRQSEPFRALCDDWRICAEASARWAASDAPVAEQRRREYDEWLAELEQEITEWLDRS